MTDKKDLKNIIILSSKSSGSTALQKCFIINGGYKPVGYTTHYGNETLYWTKAASILEREQDPMYRSVVPYTKENALNSINDFLRINLNHSINFEEDYQLPTLIKYYLELVKVNGPKFIEKSPHHLYNKSNLELILKMMDRLSNEIDFNVLGLIRHPLDVIYSGWRRWKYNCRHLEEEWKKSYENLLWFRNYFPVKLIKYEDLVNKEVLLENILGMQFLSKEFEFHSSSLKKWKKDNVFAHRLNQDTIDLAHKLGYDDFENFGNSLIWKLNCIYRDSMFKVKKIIK